MDYQTPLIIEPATTTHAVIWLHGLGANGHDFANLLPHLQLPENHHIRFVFPHANNLAVTINAGYVMPAWYDIRSVNFNDRNIDEEFEKSVAYIYTLIQQQNLPHKNILLAGFSQGGAIALHAGLNFPTPLAGIMALSTYFVDETAISQAKNEMPIFVAHGTQDPMVPSTLGQQVHQHLISKGYQATFHSYKMEHAVCTEEITDLRNFILQTLGTSDLIATNSGNAQSESSRKGFRTMASP